MKLRAVDQSLSALLRLFWASITRRVGKSQMQGIHLEQGDVIRIEGDHSSVILDGELFEASEGRPIVLRSTQPVPFLRLAAYGGDRPSFPSSPPRAAPAEDFIWKSADKHPSFPFLG